MKKYLIALLLGVGLMTMQTASAAELELDDTAGIVLNADGVSGTITGNFGFANLKITDLSGETINLLFSFTGSADGGIAGVDDPIGLGEGEFPLVFAGPGTFSISIDDSVSEVPVPAAVWLFGSALVGLLGVSRRKSSSALAA